MKIIMRHDQSSIDPSGIYSDEDFETVIERLEDACEHEIKKSYPDAEIEFERSDWCGKEIEVRHQGINDPSDDEDEISAIVEKVFETGAFWF
jgi:hypothetical protein